MAARISCYAHAADHIIRGKASWDADPVKLALATRRYTPNSVHEFFSDVEGELPAGGGYDEGGVFLTGKRVARAGLVTSFHADAVAFPDFAPVLPFAYGIVYAAQPGGPKHSPLLCSIDFGADQDPAGSLAIQWASDGVWYIGGLDTAIPILGPALVPSVIDRLIEEVQDRKRGPTRWAA